MRNEGVRKVKEGLISHFSRNHWKSPGADGSGYPPPPPESVSEDPSRPSASSSSSAPIAVSYSSCEAYSAAYTPNMSCQVVRRRGSRCRRYTPNMAIAARCQPCACDCSCGLRCLRPRPLRPIKCKRYTPVVLRRTHQLRAHGGARLKSKGLISRFSRNHWKSPGADGSSYLPPSPESVSEDSSHLSASSSGSAPFAVSAASASPFEPESSASS